MPSLCDFFYPPSKHPFTPDHPTRTGLVAGLLMLAALAPWRTPTAGAQSAVNAVRHKYAAQAQEIVLTGELAVATPAPDEPAVDCASLAGPRTMLLFVLGQSNASNTVDPGYATSQPVYAYAYADGMCHRVRDTILGATGDKGSSWSRLGDRIVGSGLADTVIFVDIARGGSSLLHWAPGGQFYPLLTGTLDALAAKGLHPTHVLFHQGEADCAFGLSRQEYGLLLSAVLDAIRAHAGSDSDIFVSRASLYLNPQCADRHDPGCYVSCPAVTEAQTAAADPARRIFSGPDTDRLIPWFDRNDGYHFTAQAADRFAAAWMPLLAGEAPRTRLQQ